MGPSKTVRIDLEVWGELQKLAKPLDDTPNSVMRRVLGLPEKGADGDDRELRVDALLQLVWALVGEVKEVGIAEHGYSFLSAAGNVVAYIEPQKERLKVVASKQFAEKLGFNDWDNELKRSRFFGGSSVHWYIYDGDAEANQRLAAVLARFWKHDLLLTTEITERTEAISYKTL